MAVISANDFVYQVPRSGKISEKLRKLPIFTTALTLTKLRG